MYGAAIMIRASKLTNGSAAAHGPARLEICFMIEKGIYG